MLIRRESDSHRAIVYRTEGFGKKPKQITLLEFIIKHQFFIFDLDAKQSIPMTVEFALGMNSAQGARIAVHDCSWSISHFEEFVAGVEDLIERSAELLMKDLSLSAALKFNDDIYVTAKCQEISVSDGPFSGSRTERHIFINFEFFGEHTEWVRWVPQMLDPIRDVAEDFSGERDEFVASVQETLKQIA